MQIYQEECFFSGMSTSPPLESVTGSGGCLFLAKIDGLGAVGRKLFDVGWGMAVGFEVLVKPSLTFLLLGSEVAWLTEVVPLWDENLGSLSANFRFKERSEKSASLFSSWQPFSLPMLSDPISSITERKEPS